jgi:RHS repeat-associated protein
VKFVYDGWNLLAELNATNNAVIRSFMWGSDLSGTSQGAGGVGGLLKVAYSGAQTTNCFVAFDGNGNVAALTDAGGTSILAQYEYGPFGEVIRATGPMAKANPFRFSTKYQDGESGLLYYGYRYCDSCTGRWVNRDPLEERSGEFSLYAFVRNDAVKNYDLLGRLGIPTCGYGCVPPPGPSPASGCKCPVKIRCVFRSGGLDVGSPFPILGIVCKYSCFYTEVPIDTAYCDPAIVSGIGSSAGPRKYFGGLTGCLCPRSFSDTICGERKP